MTTLKQVLSLEGHGDEPELDLPIADYQDVSEDDVDDARAVLLETLEAEEELHQEVRDVSALSADIEERTAAIEGWCDVLEFALEKKQFNAQTAAAASISLERYRTYFGEEANLPALENYTHAELEAYYAASLEGFKEVAGKLGKALQGAKTRIVRRIKMMQTDRSRAAALDKLADNLTARLKGVSVKEVEISARGLLTRMHFNGVVPSNLPQAVRTDMASRKHLAVQFAGAIAKHAEAIAGSAFGKDALVSALKLKHPFESLPGQYKDGSALLGGLVVFNPPAVDLNEASDSLKELAESSAVPTVKTTKADKVPDTIKLKAADVQALITALKQYAALLRLVDQQANTIGDKFEDAFYEFHKPTGDGGSPRLHSNTVTRILAYAANTMYGATHLLFFVARSTSYTATAVQQLAERAVAALERESKKEK